LHNNVSSRTHLLDHPAIHTLLYSLSLTLTLMLMDTVYAQFNQHFVFNFTTKEFANKLFALSLLISLIHAKKLRLSIYAFLSLFSLIQYAHFAFFGQNIHAIEFYLLHNNVGETLLGLSSILTDLISPFCISLAGFVILSLIDKQFNPKGYHLKYASMFFFGGLLYLSAQVFYIVNIQKSAFSHKDSKLLYPMTDRHSSRNFFVSLNYFLYGIVPQKILGTQNFPTLPKPKLINKETKRTVVLVIGESLRADSFSLENNVLTPQLQLLKNDKQFYSKSVYAGGTVTKVSVATLINRLKYPQGLSQISQQDNCLFKLAKENKFNTYFFSAQTVNQTRILRDLICTNAIDQIINRDSFNEYFEPSGYDEDLLTLLGNISTIQSNDFIVLQQRGSHTPYKNQYPPAYDLYSPYDNSVLYTDNNLYALINSLKQKIDEEYFILFVSDHGELLGGKGKHGHGHLNKHIYTVPFIMYTNTQDSTLTSIFDDLKSHYDINNFILRLLGYKSDINRGEDRKIYILNADLDGFSGYGIIDVKDGIESPLQIHDR